MKSNKHLKYLDLSFNKIYDGGITQICEMMKSNSTLKVLYLHGNRYN